MVWYCHITAPKVHVVSVRNVELLIFKYKLAEGRGWYEGIFLRRTQVFYPNLGLIWEFLVSDLAVPVGQNISGLPNLDLALTYANITTGRMLWQYFKFVRKYACCTNSLSDLAYAMYLRRSQPFAYAVPGRLPAKDGYAQDPRLLGS